jgi:hypothetical protein
VGSIRSRARVASREGRNRRRALDDEVHLAERSPSMDAARRTVARCAAASRRRRWRRAICRERILVGKLFVMPRLGDSSAIRPPAAHRFEEKHMNKRIVAVACIVPLMASVGVVPRIAFAADSCTEWMDQGDGTSWKECVDDDGKQICYSVNNTPGSVARKVSCS